MFLFMTNRIPELFPAIKKVIWNYSEAGHGKGAPDGVGGVLKRTADRTVALGLSDIANFDDFFETIQKNTKNILLFKVDDAGINTESSWLKENNKDHFTVKGSMKVHQVCWGRSSPNIMFRALTCFTCDETQHCPHYHISTVTKCGSNRNSIQDHTPIESNMTHQIGKLIFIYYNLSIMI